MYLMYAKEKIAHILLPRVRELRTCAFHARRSHAIYISHSGTNYLHSLSKPRKSSFLPSAVKSLPHGYILVKEGFKKNLTILIYI